MSSPDPDVKGSGRREELPRLVCASANPHKVREIADVLSGLVILDPRPAGVAEVIEDAPTLLGNARLKARAILEAPENTLLLPAVADDTGLFVDALPGQLGVRTARYAQEDPDHGRDPDRANRRQLLRALRDQGCVRPEQRSAYFLTVAVVCFPDGTEVIAEGRCQGRIALEERGNRGFGFDALFIPDLTMTIPGERTFAEMSDEEKNALSHRGQAFTDLARQLQQLTLKNHRPR